MRIWSLHPSYLDSRGLVALWREGLLAQMVLAGKTMGYRRHPQLVRFRNQQDSLSYIGAYLRGVADEAKKRGYGFNEAKILKVPKLKRSIQVTRGQMDFEFVHLLKKLQKRDSKRFEALTRLKRIRPHPLFLVVKGEVEDWEKVN